MAEPDDLEAPVHHVVHLVPDLDSPTPPAELGYPAPYPAAARGLILVALLAGTAAAAVMLASLWLGETPGLWFQLLFTVFIGGIAVAMWAVAVGARATGRQRAAATAAWAAGRDRAVPAAGRVTARHVALSDVGGVSAFDVVVDVGGERVAANWVPYPKRSVTLLQPQVPGVGAPVRVWSVTGDPASPRVVEVVDPTRVT